MTASRQKAIVLSARFRATPYPSAPKTVTAASAENKRIASAFFPCFTKETPNLYASLSNFFIRQLQSRHSSARLMTRT